MWMAEAVQDAIHFLSARVWTTWAYKGLHTVASIFQCLEGILST